MRLLALLLLALLGPPALAQHGTVVSRDGRQLVVRLNDDVTVLAPDLGNVMVPDTEQTSAQVIVNAVRGSLAECTIMTESSSPPEEGYPVRFDRPVLQGSLAITSAPPDAAVTVDGVRSGRTPLNELLAAGSYRIGLTRAGYEPDSAVVTVVAGQRATHHRSLTPLTAPPPAAARPPAEGVRLVLSSTPGQARILIDGQPQGLTREEGLPPRVIDLPAAPRYAVEIQLSKYLSQFDTLTVEPGQVWEEHYTLEEKRSPVSVLVYPWGSQVFLDDVPVGQTPYAGTLPWGYHTVRVERPGFVPLVQDSVFVWGMRSQRGTDMASIVEADLQRDVGWLRVRSGSPGLQVRLDGVVVGRTPLDLRVPSGSYDVLIEAGGTPRHQERVTVGVRDDVTVSIEAQDPRGARHPRGARPSPPIASAADPATLPPAPTPPPPAEASPAGLASSNELLAQGLTLTREGEYEAARAVLLEAQALSPGSLELARAIAEVDRVRGLLQALSPRDREDVDILRRRIREDALTRDYGSLLLAAQRLFEYVPHDPATQTALRRGLGRVLAPGNGPVIELVYVFGTAEYPLTEQGLEAVEQPPYNGFLLSTTEITNAHFAAFLNAQDRPRDRDGNPLLAPGTPTGLVEGRHGWVPEAGLEHHPATDASWYGARAYAEWAGGRLPSRDEWAWAFALGRAEAEAPPGAHLREEALADADGDGLRPRSVGELAPDGLGLHDMAGNVWEWAGDELRGRDPQRIIMGGSFRTPPLQPGEVPSAAAPANNGSGQVGFRLLLPVE